MNNNPINQVKDTMWSFFLEGAQRPNIPTLRDEVYNLIQMTTQSTAGQRKKKNDIDWNGLDMTLMHIAIEATALVLSGEIDKLEGEAAERQRPEIPMLEANGYADGELVYDTWYCPGCDKAYEVDGEKYNYCPNCGQAIDWEEE